MKNIELKIKISDHREIVSELKKLRARKIGILNQVDIYFNCPTGRFKLREINNKNFELIYYKRADSAKSKVSEGKLLVLSKIQKNHLLKIFAESYGQMVVVKKRREFWMYRQTRVHLDTVSKLGKFLELENLQQVEAALIGRPNLFGKESLNGVKKYHWS